MFIRDLFFQLKVQLYPLRYFLQKKEYPIEVVYDTIEGLEELNPDFISVTYGAGGSSKDRTIEMASKIKK